MRLSLSILFDRPMNQYNNIPSPGGYEVKTADGNIYGFDFNESEGSISSENPRVVEWLLRDEDLTSFPEIQKLRTKLPSIREITECYLDMEGLEIPSDDYPIAQKILTFEFESTIKPTDDTSSNEYVHTDVIQDIGIFSMQDKILHNYVFPQS